MRKSDSPSGAVIIGKSYDDISDHPAWVHFQSRLFELRASLEEHILQGRLDALGTDRTPEMRAALGVLLQVIAIPEYARQGRAHAEEMILGRPLAQANSTFVEGGVDYDPFGAVDSQ